MKATCSVGFHRTRACGPASPAPSQDWNQLCFSHPPLFRYISKGDAFNCVLQHRLSSLLGSREMYMLSPGIRGPGNWARVRDSHLLPRRLVILAESVRVQLDVSNKSQKTQELSPVLFPVKISSCSSAFVGLKPAAPACGTKSPSSLVSRARYPQGPPRTQ